MDRARSLRITAIWSALAVLFTGCLTIEENYTFKKNGSGTMEYVVDLSAFGEMMESFSKMGGEEKGDDGLEGMNISDQADKLKGLAGIGGVKVKNKEKYIKRVSFKFKDIDALNRALNVLLPDSSGIDQTFWRWEGSTLVRTNNRHAAELGNDMGTGEASDSTDPTAFLQSMHYKYSFKFALPISDHTVADGVVVDAPDQKRLDLDTDWSVIMNDPKALDLRITLSK
ncbi:MAG: hypothetical protein H6595_02990 [Flavobacteriales bacterium]|nr:hypothetical protein [Flavobacteriales bacterium]MCB9166423.1 hypothetical protein [Flavobacteriales bacterium]